MEIGKNVSEKKIHCVQSVPSFSQSEERSKRNRRVSFATSPLQLAQYLEPINPFETLGEWLSYEHLMEIVN
jgi:hypothetical protein